MDDSERQYLEKMSSVETPKKVEEQSKESYQSICSFYDAIKYIAKQSLDGKLDPKITKNHIEVILKSAEQIK